MIGPQKTVLLFSAQVSAALAGSQKIISSG